MKNTILRNKDQALNAALAILSPQQVNKRSFDAVYISWQGGLWFWKALRFLWVAAFVPPQIWIRKEPERQVRIEEEYQLLRERQPINPFMKF